MNINPSTNLVQSKVALALARITATAARHGASVSPATAGALAAALEKSVAAFVEFSSEAQLAFLHQLIEQQGSANSTPDESGNQLSDQSVVLQKIAESLAQGIKWQELTPNTELNWGKTIPPAIIGSETGSPAPQVSLLVTQIAEAVKDLVSQAIESVKTESAKIAGTNTQANTPDGSQNPDRVAALQTLAAKFLAQFKTQLNSQINALGISEFFPSSPQAQASFPASIATPSQVGTSAVVNNLDGSDSPAPQSIEGLAHALGAAIKEQSIQCNPLINRMFVKQTQFLRNSLFAEMPAIPGIEHRTREPRINLPALPLQEASVEINSDRPFASIAARPLLPAQYARELLVSLAALAAKFYRLNEKPAARSLETLGLILPLLERAPAGDLEPQVVREIQAHLGLTPPELAAWREEGIRFLLELVRAESGLLLAQRDPAHGKISLGLQENKIVVLLPPAADTPSNQSTPTTAPDSKTIRAHQVSSILMGSGNIIAEASIGSGFSQERIIHSKISDPNEPASNAARGFSNELPKETQRNQEPHQPPWAVWGQANEKPAFSGKKRKAAAVPFSKPQTINDEIETAKNPLEPPGRAPITDPARLLEYKPVEILTPTWAEENLLPECIEVQLC